LDELFADPVLGSRMKDMGVETIQDVGVLSVFAAETALTGAMGPESVRLLVDFSRTLEHNLVLSLSGTAVELRSSHENGSSVYECSITDDEAELMWRVEFDRSEFDDLWARRLTPSELLGQSRRSAFASWPCQDARDLLCRTARPAVLDLSDLETIMSSLSARQRKVLALRFGLLDGKPRSLEEVGQMEGVTRERIRQIQEKAIQRLQHPSRRRALSRLTECIRQLQEILATGVDTDKFRDALSTFSTASAWDVRAVLNLLIEIGFVGSDQRPSLLDFEEQIELAMVNHLGSMPTPDEMRFPPREVLLAVMNYPEVKETLRHWPQFSPYGRLKLLAPLATGSRRFSSTQTRLAALTSVLCEEGRPLHYSEIARRVDERLPADLRMGERNVHAWLARYSNRFVWAGPGKYGLREWDVGRRIDLGDVALPNGLRPTRRRGIAEEIALLLVDAGEPLPLSEIEDRILSRFDVNAASVRAAIEQDRAKRFILRADDYVELASWRADPGTARSDGRSKWRIRRAEFQELIAKAEDAMGEIRRAIDVGGARTRADLLYGWLVLTVALKQRDEVAALVRFPAIREIPEQALHALLSYGSQRDRKLIKLISR